MKYSIEVEEKEMTSLNKIIKYISKIDICSETILAFRGEKADYHKPLTPSIYRNNFFEKEELIYREMQRFNNHEFMTDRTTFDKLSRMQHYFAPTRLLDISEDIMSAIYFAIDGKNQKDKENAIIYIFELDKNQIKYYDSDAVSVVSNIAKLPLIKKYSQKSKKNLLCDINRGLKKKKFNKQKSVKFLRHEIREEKSQFEPIINPQDLISIQCVRPKLTNDRIKFQKGFFLLFGLNPNDERKHIPLIKDNKLLNNDRVQHPIKKLHKLILKSSKIEDMKKTLKKIGISKPFIYPEIDKVADYLNKLNKVKDEN